MPQPNFEPIQDVLSLFVSRLLRENSLILPLMTAPLGEKVFAHSGRDERSNCQHSGYKEPDFYTMIDNLNIRERHRLSPNAQAIVTATSRSPSSGRGILFRPWSG